MKLNVRVGDESHIITVPEYIADGLNYGTIQPISLAWLSVVVIVVYIFLMGADCPEWHISDFGLTLGGATIAAIVATAWLGGSPLVCSGIAGDIDRYSIGWVGIYDP